MYKNKIIDKALEEEEKRREELEKERVKKTYEFMETFIGTDYRESFKEVWFEDYHFPFFEPIGYEGIVFYISFNDEDESDIKYHVLKVSGNKLQAISYKFRASFINILDFSLYIKEAFERVEMEKKEEEERGKNIKINSQEKGWKSWIPKGLRGKL